MKSPGKEGGVDRQWLVGHLSVTLFCPGLLLSSSGWHTPPVTLAPRRKAYIVLNFHRGVFWLHPPDRSFPGFRHSLRAEAMSQLPFNPQSLAQLTEYSWCSIHFFKKHLNITPPLSGYKKFVAHNLRGNVWWTSSPSCDGWRLPSDYVHRRPYVSVEDQILAWSPWKQRGALRSLHRNNKCIL